MSAYIRDLDGGELKGSNTFMVSRAPIATQGLSVDHHAIHNYCGSPLEDRRWSLYECRFVKWDGRPVDYAFDDDSGVERKWRVSLLEKY